MTLRPFQQQIDEALERVAARASKVRKFVCDVTTGGGKSEIPRLVAQRLIPSVVDKVCWISPRRNLRYAATRIMAARGYPIMIGANSLRPSKDTNGYACTYDLVSSLPELHRDEFECHRYALILDEPHHICAPWEHQTPEEFKWFKSIEPLIQRAKFLVLMSGTMERGDKRPIAFIDYGANGKPACKDTEHTSFFSYTRTQALADGCIVPVEFHHIDGSVAYVDGNGETRQHTTLQLGPDDCRAALFTAVSKDYGEALLRKGLLHWKSMRQNELGYANTQALIVAKDVQQAHAFAKLASEITGEECKCVTSETPEQDELMQRFKDGKIPILSTCQMAYEGMDAPAISHVISLTLIRSKPWIEQMIGRAVRKFEGKTRSFIFCPDDTLMCELIEQIRSEQTNALKQLATIQGQSSQSRTGEQFTQIVPVAASATSVRIEGLDCGTAIEPEQLAYIQREAPGLIGKESEVMRLLQKINAKLPRCEVKQERLVVTPDDVLKNVRAQLQKACSTKDRLMEWTHGQANTVIKRMFGKSRENMSDKEVTTAWAWVVKNWPDCIPDNYARKNHAA